MAIKISKNGFDYLLEYDRTTISQLEKMGFSLQDYSNHPATMMPLLFRGAFLKNHKFVKQAEIDDIYNSIKNKTELMSKLIDMLGTSYESLMENDEGNLDWEEA